MGKCGLKKQVMPIIQKKNDNSNYWGLRFFTFEIYIQNFNFLRQKSFVARNECPHKITTKLTLHIFVIAHSINVTPTRILMAIQHTFITFILLLIICRRTLLWLHTCTSRLRCINLTQLTIITNMYLLINIIVQPRIRIYQYDCNFHLNFNIAIQRGVT